MVAKSLDVYSLAKLLVEKEMRAYAVVAKELSMSASEFHAAVQRLIQAGLVDGETRKPRKKSVEEFLLHGVRYVFPAIPGPVTRGVATAHAAAPLKDLISSDAGGMCPFWPDAGGTMRGYSIEPLHPSAPRAAQMDSALYELLALIDALREGRARERQIAGEQLHKRIYQQ